MTLTIQEVSQLNKDHQTPLGSTKIKLYKPHFRVGFLTKASRFLISNKNANFGEWNLHIPFRLWTVRGSLHHDNSNWWCSLINLGPFTVGHLHRFSIRVINTSLFTCSTNLPSSHCLLVKIRSPNSWRISSLSKALPLVLDRKSKNWLGVRRWAQL